MINGFNVWNFLQFDPITDPLGICGPPSNGANHSMAMGLKRRASEEGVGMPPMKKFILS